MPEESGQTPDRYRSRVQDPDRQAHLQELAKERAEKDAENKRKSSEHKVRAAQKKEDIEARIKKGLDARARLQGGESDDSGELKHAQSEAADAMVAVDTFRGLFEGSHPNNADNKYQVMARMHGRLEMHLADAADPENSGSLAQAQVAMEALHKMARLDPYEPVPIIIEPGEDKADTEVKKREAMITQMQAAKDKWRGNAEEVLIIEPYAQTEAEAEVDMEEAQAKLARMGKDRKFNRGTVRRQSYQANRARRRADRRLGERLEAMGVQDARVVIIDLREERRQRYAPKDSKKMNERGEIEITSLAHEERTRVVGERVDQHKRNLQAAVDNLNTALAGEWTGKIKITGEEDPTGEKLEIGEIGKKLVLDDDQKEKVEREKEKAEAAVRIFDAKSDFQKFTDMFQQLKEEKEAEKRQLLESRIYIHQKRLKGRDLNTFNALSFDEQVDAIVDLLGDEIRLDNVTDVMIFDLGGSDVQTVTDRAFEAKALEIDLSATDKEAGIALARQALENARKDRDLARQKKASTLPEGVDPNEVPKLWRSVIEVGRAHLNLWGAKLKRETTRDGGLKDSVIRIGAAVDEKFIEKVNENANAAGRKVAREKDNWVAGVHQTEADTKMVMVEAKRKMYEEYHEAAVEFRRRQDHIIVLVAHGRLSIDVALKRELTTIATLRDPGKRLQEHTRLHKRSVDAHKMLSSLQEYGDSQSDEKLDNNPHFDKLDAAVMSLVSEVVVELEGVEDAEPEEENDGYTQAFLDLLENSKDLKAFDAKFYGDRSGLKTPEEAYAATQEPEEEAAAEDETPEETTEPTDESAQEPAEEESGEELNWWQRRARGQQQAEAAQEPGDEQPEQGERVIVEEEVPELDVEEPDM